MKDLIFSICIPTCKRPDILRETLKSIYSQDTQSSLFEVCISDNSDTDETEELIKNEFGNIANLVYKRSDCKGFFNSIEALKLGKGRFLKLLNDYSVLKENSLEKFITSVRNLKSPESVIFYSMHALRKQKVLQEFGNFNDFLYDISYYSTWSTSFAIWKKDFDCLIQSDIEIDYMYPHTSFLFALTDKKQYIVDDYEYVTNLQPKKKGGYNLVDNFVRIYLTMVEELYHKNYICKKTYLKIKNQILWFVADWKCQVKYNDCFTFTFDNCNQIIRNKCGTGAVVKFEFKYFYHLCKYRLYSLIRENKN